MNRIALIVPTLIGHKYRGTGVYTQNLFQELKKLSNIQVDLVTFKNNLKEFDLVHYPFFDPFFLTYPLFKTKPTVITIHDLIPLKFPQHFPRGILGEVKWQIQKLSVKSSSAIITDSNASNNDIEKIIGYKKTSVYTIPLGVSSDFSIIKSDDFKLKTKNKYSLPDHFILNVGDVNYNKNSEGLITAFNLIADKFKHLDLVLIGKGFIDPSSQLINLKSLINNFGLEDRIHRLANVSPVDLVAIYNLADIYIQPSFAEGFGLPILEAMSCGCPVIASNIDSHMEILGDAALTFNPNNIQDIVIAVEKLLTSDQLNKKFIVSGLIQAKKYTWKTTAQRTFDVYQRLIK